MRRRYEQALAEVEEMKRTLREHAQHVAAREKELEELRLDVAGRQGRRRSTAPAAGPAAAPARQSDLDKKLAEAEKREREAVQELALAKAERERLDEREQSIRKVERELAGLRIQLQQERARGTGSAPEDSAPSEPEPTHEADPDREPPPPTPLPQPPTEPDLEPAAGSKLRRSSMLADPQLRKNS